LRDEEFYVNMIALKK